MGTTELSAQDVDNHQTGDKGRKFIIPTMMVAFLAVFLAGTLRIAIRRPLWNDELFTYYIATLPNFSDVWSALSTGHEQIPLGFYAIERFALGVLGTNSVALRLPALLGCMLLSLALFKFVSRRLPPAYALLAALFPMITTACDFAREARPYGLELGFAALALLCWQRATLSESRLPALAGLGLSLVAAISCHYYGVLLVLPLALGELLRTVTRRKIDYAIWVCFAGSAIPLLFMLPLIESGFKFSDRFWAQPQWADIGGFYSSLMAKTAFPLVVVVALGLIACRFLRSVTPRDPNGPDSSFPPHELAAIAGFTFLPLAGVLAAKLVTNAYVDRYVVAAVVGLGVLFSQAMYKMFRGDFRIATVIALLLLGWFGILEITEGRLAQQARWSLDRSIALLKSADEEGLPIVALDSHTFLELAHYAPPDISSRLIYLVDASPSARIPALEAGMLELVGPWFHMPVTTFDKFVDSKARFFIYGDVQLASMLSSNWMMRALKDRSFRIAFQSYSDNKYLFSVAPPDQ